MGLHTTPGHLSTVCAFGKYKKNGRIHARTHGRRPNQANFSSARGARRSRACETEPEYTELSEGHMCTTVYQANSPLGGDSATRPSI
jgi:hypothetical protein